MKCFKFSCAGKPYIGRLCKYHYEMFKMARRAYGNTGWIQKPIAIRIKPRQDGK